MCTKPTDVFEAQRKPIYQDCFVEGEHDNKYNLINDHAFYINGIYIIVNLKKIVVWAIKTLLWFIKVSQYMQIGRLVILFSRLIEWICV